MIASPFAGTSYATGEVVAFQGSAQDPEDGALTGANLVWTDASGSTLATGETFQTDTLALGQHTITLTATDSAGASASTSVTIRIAEPAPAPAPRYGQTNPYAGRIQRLPVKLDDEPVVIGASTAQKTLTVGVIDQPVTEYEGPTGPTAGPRTVLQRDATTPIAAAAGRVLNSNLEQAAIVSATTGAAGTQWQLDLVNLAAEGQSEIVQVPFAPPFPASPMAVGVADLDAFDEVYGGKLLTPQLHKNTAYHDEVVLAYPETISGELRARVRVLSFEDLEFAEQRDPGAPAPSPTSETAAATSEALWPGSRIVVLHGDALFAATTGPHLVIAYLNALKQVAIDVFAYDHTRADPATPDPRTDTRTLTFVRNVVLSTPLTDAAAAAGGWDVTIGRADELGMNMLSGFDIVLAVTQENGQYREAAWKLEDLDGMPNPKELASKSGQFASVTDAGGTTIPLSILPDSRVRVALGRIVDPDPNRCETIGLFVLADTNRGAVVQSMAAFIDDPFIGSSRFGPLYNAPAWPHTVTILARPDTTTASRVSIAAGGFVSTRNALIDDRGDSAGIGTEYAHDCANAHTAPYLGPMPSFYVAEPEMSQLYAVTMLLGAVLGNGAAVAAPLDPSIDAAMLLAADANGDAAYYWSMNCIGQNPGDCRRVFLSDAELHYTIENLHTSNVILQQPPKHVDYLRELGGIVDVSMRPDYYAEFAQTDTVSGKVDRKTKTDWTVGLKEGFATGKETTSKGSTFSSQFDMSLDVEHQSVDEEFTSTETSVSLTQSTGAVDDDVIWSKLQTIDYWRFPAQGGKPIDNATAASGFADDAYMEISIPGDPETMIGPGTLSDDYQPTHQVGNILTYPTISGTAQDIGQLFDLLGTYVPTDANGTRQCKPASSTDPLGCVIKDVNGALQQVAQVLAGDEFVGGEFLPQTNPIDVANILQVGGITYSSQLEFTNEVKQGQTLTNTDTVKVEANLKLSTKPDVPEGKDDAEKLFIKSMPKKTAEANYQLRATAAFENERTSENTLGSKTTIALHLPADIPVERSYRIRPSFGFTPGGSLNVSYAVGTDGAAETFWQGHYSGPDPALNMPHRIVHTANGWQLGTDFSRDRIKGLFFRDGTNVDPQHVDATEEPLLTAAPAAGDKVQLEVRVYNLSVATPVSNLVVRFSAQKYENGQTVGDPILLGDTTIEYLPYRGEFSDDANGHIANAFYLWDTTGFGPLPGNALATYLVYVTLDPDNAIGNETHELYDRFADPLVGPTGQTLDAELEKGQNNKGWSMIRIAPPLTPPPQVAAIQKSGGTYGLAPSGGSNARQKAAVTFIAGDAPVTFLTLPAGTPAELAVDLASTRLERDYGLLQVFDGDPAHGGQLILSRTVQGLSDGEVSEPFTWRPDIAGQHVLNAVYLSSDGTGTRSTQRLFVRVGG
jgi:hypothetical protein